MKDLPAAFFIYAVSSLNDKSNRLNKYAVTNSDIVNALLESSSAMAAANNTFDQTIALATAAIEITRDAREAGKMIARSYSNVA